MTWDSSTRVAVLGGGGFVGSHVVTALRRRGLDPVIPRTADGWDFRDPANAARFFDQHRPELVINCAARQGGLEYQRLYPADIYYDNLLLGLHAMHAAAHGGVRRYVDVIAACSYPAATAGVSSEDDYWSGPLHDSVLNYGFTRKAQLVQGVCYRRQYGFESIPLLMTNLYGPGEHFHPDRSHGLAALLRKFFDAKRFGRPSVEIWGSGDPIREWLFVEDAADAIVAATSPAAGCEPLNASVGHGCTIRELAATIQRIVGFEGEVVYDRSKPEGAACKIFSNERIRQRLGWQPKVGLEDGIARTLAWLDQHYAEAVSRG